MMIEKSYQIITTLGIGGAGEVYSIRNIKDNTIMAAKFARKDLKVTQQKKFTLLNREKEIMEELHDHPNILNSLQMYKKRKITTQCNGFEAAQQEFDMHLTTSPFHMIEYCENGSFITYLRNQQALTEDIVTFYTEQLLGCMEYVHFKGYAHLDIKLDNILLDDNFNIRLSDFGSAVKLDDHAFTTFRRGTPKYMAPEVLYLQEGESFDAYKADVYSLGVCIYLMLFKRFPVHEAKEYPATKDLLEDPELCKTCPFDCDKERWSQLSSEIQRILIA
jgi:serine/threonine protein kinase